MIQVAEHPNTRHGGARRSGRAPEYFIWHGMRQRCENPKSEDFSRYGARGIKVCDRWRDYANFIADMGLRPTVAHTLERQNNDGGYSPYNCTWATRTEQARNRRPRPAMESCRKGHPLSGENVYERPDGKRGCRKCRRENMREFNARRKERIGGRS